MTQNIRAGGAWHLVYVLDPFPPFHFSGKSCNKKLDVPLCGTILWAKIKIFPGCRRFAPSRLPLGFTTFAMHF